MTPIAEAQKNRIAELLSEQAALGSLSPIDNNETEGGIPLTFDDGPREGVPAVVEREVKKLAKREIGRQAIVTQSGELKPCLANALNLLRFDPAWMGVLHFDEFKLRIVVQKKTPWGKPVGENWNDFDDAKALEWFERHNLFLGSSMRAAEAVRTVAQENPFHPVRDWLKSLKWDGTARLDSLFPVYAGAENTAFNQAVGRCALISAVARIFAPGCKVDSVPLLIGRQGAGKSSFVSSLVPKPEYFSDHVSDLTSKDSRLELHGKMLIEFADLDRVKGAPLNRVKAFISTQVDSFRPPYLRSVVDVPRSCTFWGTSNDQIPLADETGARRFWPVHVSDALRLDKLRADRDQLWAEAVDRYRQGARWYLDTKELNAAAKEQQDACYGAGVWDSLIEEFLENPQPRTLSDKPFLSQPNKVLVSEILEHKIGKEPDAWTQQDMNSVVRCLTHLGFDRRQLRADGSRRMRFYCRGVIE